MFFKSYGVLLARLLTVFLVKQETHNLGTSREKELLPLSVDLLLKFRVLLSEIRVLATYQLILVLYFLILD